MLKNAVLMYFSVKLHYLILITFFDDHVFFNHSLCKIVCLQWLFLVWGVSRQMDLPASSLLSAGVREKLRQWKLANVLRQMAVRGHAVCVELHSSTSAENSNRLTWLLLIIGMG